MDSSLETISANSWIFSEGAMPGYFVYKLLKGKVSIYTGGVKVNEMEVKQGDSPVYLGIMSALRNDRHHAASVKSETELEVERIYTDELRLILHNEIPSAIRIEVDAMIGAVALLNQITCLQAKFNTLPKLSFDMPEDASPETREILKEISELYQSLQS